MKTRVYDEINRAFRPEFLNRLSDEAIIFRHLEKKDLKEVIELEVSKIRHRLEERGFALEISNDAKEFLIKKGTNLDFGARPLRRALENFIEDPLSEELLHGNFQGKNHITVEVARDDEGKFKHLVFNSAYVEPPAPSEPVAVAAGDVGDSEAEPAADKADE